MEVKQMRIVSNIACLLIGAMIGSIGLHLMEGNKTPRVHKLQFPLALSGGSGNGPTTILPKGTSLYYDQAFPEGFVRYKIYVNVEGIKLDSQEVTERLRIDPLTAFPFDKDNLQK